ncbi:putative YIPF5 like protein [Blattamonas nauphoetae]|uniref:YIPF5 like protein n=1 Tax=Blattamonas nauphoetae TaxID=2049346 RepID=A0ABQ9XAJ4_9EUKA|nr:putative YIPF5 like protein [Blattamonas nauphoetae]
MTYQFPNVPFENSDPYAGMYQQTPQYTQQLQLHDEAPDPPLMEELGIEPDKFLRRFLSIINPFGKPDTDAWAEGDLTGFVVFIVVFCFLILVKGKHEIGYIMGFSIIGSFLVYFLLNMMAPADSLTSYKVISVLGFSLLPLLILALFSLVINLKGVVGVLITIVLAVWCSFAATNILVAMMGYYDIRYLVGYPLFLFFMTFAINALY